MRSSKALKTADAHVTLALLGRRVDPHSLTAALRVEPSRAWSAGETFALPGGRTARRFTGMWAVEREGDAVDAMAVRLLDSFVAEQLRATAQRIEAECAFAIAWDPRGTALGFTLSSSTVRRMSDTADRIDVYYFGLPEGDGAPARDRGPDRATVALMGSKGGARAPHCACRAVDAQVQPALEELARSIERGHDQGLMGSAARRLSIAWEPEADLGGYSLRPEPLRQLSMLVESIDFAFG